MGNTILHDSIDIHQLQEGVLIGWRNPEPSDVNKSLLIQEREVSYRFELHQHPFTNELIKRLVTRGTSALQAADTEFVAGTQNDPGNPARPGSVVFALGDDVVLTIPEGARGALIANVTVSVNGASLELGQSMSVKIGPGAAQARVHANPDAVPRLEATLLGGLKDLPEPGKPFPLPDGSQALLRGNTLIKLEGSAPIVLPGGASSALPAGTELALADGTVILPPNGTSATLLRGQRLPVLFGPALAAYIPGAVVEQPYPVKDLDFRYGAAYSAYNWELFFHVPLTIAINLMKNGRYAEAQRWFHYVFDPTDNSDGPTPERFWKVLPFQTTEVKRIEQVLANLATGADPELRTETIRSINDWQNNPFQPHAVARIRQGAYMLKTVMAYLDNLIAWGDSLFRQDTGEAIDEALMLYVLAANILGAKPQAVPAKGSIRPQTYHNLRQDLKRFGVVARELETAAPFVVAPLPARGTGDTSSLATLRGLGRALYFCVPRNDKLLSYWDTVADRLFKIRNSLNIQGAFRQLALFEPPIDPALLVRAAAAGLDVAAIVNGLNQPLPLVRFQLLVQKAMEIVQEVKSLGSNLLSAMEKEDNETLALLRAKHERVVMAMVEQIKYSQLQEAIKAKEGLLASLALAAQRYTYYEMQLGMSVDDINKSIQELDELDRDGLNRMKVRSVEPELKMRDMEANIFRNFVSDVSGALGAGAVISTYEAIEIGLLLAAQIKKLVASGARTVATAADAAIPKVEVQTMPFGLGSTVKVYDLAQVARGTASTSDTIADLLGFGAQMAARVDSFDRRRREWVFQSNLAAAEINQIYKQLRAAQLREAIAEQELTSHRKQMEHAEEIERFLNGDGTQPNGKVTNQALYAFQKREIRGMYAQCFQLAFDTAKKAERALQHELGDPSLTYLQFGYLAGKEGLLAGEKLYLDVKRMEMAYLELNRREYELTKHVSLLQVDPLALIQLRTTGRCTVKLEESLFDMDGPGHYFRRIKNVAVSIPCVAGPFTSVNCTLTLLKSSIRTTATVGDEDYARTDGEDSRFSDYFGSLQSIVTSSAQNDSGLFETNLRDERYLPFENSGVISEWQLQLPANPSVGEPAQFDYDTISDVILHIRYTAREGGESLRRAAAADLKARIDAASALGSTRLFSLRHEFPSAWAAFKAAPVVGDMQPLSITLTPQHFPFWSKPRPNEQRTVVEAELLVRAKDKDSVEVAGLDDNSAPINDQTDEFGAFPGGLQRVTLETAPKPVFDGVWRVGLSANKIEDAWLLVKWGNGVAPI